MSRCLVNSRVALRPPAGGSSWRWSARHVQAVILLLAGLVLTTSVGCPPPNRVIETLPPPALPPIKPGASGTPPAPTPPTTPTTRTLSGRKIMVDPGHGGKDVGAWKATRSSVPEKTIVLDIGNRLADSLRSMGAQVICTRTRDVFVELDDRAKAADRYKVDLFVSVHADSAPRTSASGTEIHVYDAASATSEAAARYVIAAIRKAGIECRGMQHSNYHVLREHSRPAMLIECGFMTNAEDARDLNSPAFRAKLAAAIADGVAAYLCR